MPLCSPRAVRRRYMRLIVPRVSMERRRGFVLADALMRSRDLTRGCTRGQLVGRQNCHFRLYRIDWKYGSRNGIPAGIVCRWLLRSIQGVIRFSRWIGDDCNRARWVRAGLWERWFFFFFIVFRIIVLEGNLMIFYSYATTFLRRLVRIIIRC